MKRISSGDDLASFVLDRRQALADRYELLASEMSKFGEPELESIYQSLAKDAVHRNTAKTQTNGAAYVPLPRNVDLPDVASLSTSYSIWAFAVSNELRLLDELTTANISIGDSHMQSALAEEARACLDRAANYREQRRIAFHAERLSDKIAQFPDIRRIDTVEDFAHVALAIEHYFSLLLEGYDGSAGDISEIIHASDKAILYLEPIGQSSDVSKRLGNPLKRLAKVTASQVGGTATNSRRMTQITLEADRIFDYYDRVFETAQDPEVTTASQLLSNSILDRLRILRGLQSAADHSGNSA